MGRLTVRLPDTLHHQLTTLAKRESVSLNQYIVYALTRQTTLYSAQRTPPEEIQQQRSSFEALLESLGEASQDKVERVLAERDVVEPETKLEKATVECLKERIAERRGVAK